MAGPQWSQPTEASGTIQALKALSAQLVSVAGPAAQAGFALARAQSGIPDCAVTRKTEYRSQRLSVADRTSQYGYANTVPSQGEIIRLLHQRRLVDVGTGFGLSGASWTWAKDRLAANGVDMALPGEAGAPADANDWLEIVRMAATAAPLGDIVRNWHRLQFRGDALEIKANAELDFALRRQGVSREADRELIKFPYAAWGPEQIERLNWLGMLDEVNRIKLFGADGYGNLEDRKFAEWLTARIPSADTMVAWGIKRLWDQEIATRYGLDDAYNQSPAAIYWAKAQGLGLLPGELEDQPQAELDFLKLTFRDQATLPNFGLATEMQHRLRPLPEGGEMSVVPGVPKWTDEDTRNMLRREGYSEVVIERMIGLTTVPLNVRILNTTLHEALLHPNVAQDAQDAFGAGVDWVKGIYLDHGFSEPVSKMAADAARAKADDAYNAEMKATQASQRKQRRELAKKRYLLGILSDEQYALDAQDEFYDSNMARADLEQMSREWHTSIVETQIAEIRKAFMAGKISIDQVGAQLAGGGIQQARTILYVQEWVWERNESLRVLSTGEVMAAVKAGLMDPTTAILRLTNLGWSAPDAVIELALVEQEIARAQLKERNIAQSKLSSSLAARERQAIAETKARVAAEAKAKAAAVKAAREATLAPVEREEAKQRYQGAAYLDLAAYNAAAAKGKTEKMNAEIAKAAAAYAAWLSDQLKAGFGAEDVGNVPDTIDTERIEVPPPSAGTGDDTGPASPSSDTAPAADGGNGAATGA